MVASSGHDGTRARKAERTPAEDAAWLAARARDLVLQGTPRDGLVALDMALELVHGAPPDALQADLLREKGSLLAELGDRPGAESLVQRSLEMARNVRYASGVTAARHVLDALRARHKRCS